MLLHVSDECRRLGLRAGAIEFRDLYIAPAGAELRAVIADEVRLLRARGLTVDDVRSLPQVVAFQELLRKVHVNPRRLQPSVERLLNGVVRRGELPSINSLVDAYNLVSVRSLCSLGAHDLDQIAPPVSLRILDAGKSFVPLGHSDPEPITAGEYGYVDDVGQVLCRLDVVQADFSKVTVDTTHALLIIEATAEHAPAVVRQAFDEAVELITRHCGGRAEVVAWPD